MSSFLKQIAMSVPAVARLLRERDALAKANEALTAEVARLQDQGNIAAASVAPAETLIQMAFSTWSQSADFMVEARFQDAYRFGTNSGHSYGDKLLQEWKFYIACCLASYAKHLPGDFVECGVNTGMISLTICRYLDLNAIGKRFFLFDTYQGIPEKQMSAVERGYALDMNKNFYPDVYAIAKKNFEPFPSAHLIRGIVPDSLSQVAIDRVCYLHLDMNIAAPEIAALNFFWDKLLPGAIVLLDDYNWKVHIGQKTAMDAFAAEKNLLVVPLPTTQGLIIKPPLP